MSLRSAVSTRSALPQVGGHLGAAASHGRRAGAAARGRRVGGHVRAAVEPEEAAKKKDMTSLKGYSDLDDKLQDLFPEREPGSFPRTNLHPSGWMGETLEEPQEDFDPLRDGPLRYLGYANELGEAFAAFLPAGGVPLSYAVAIGYVLVDTADKGIKAKTTSLSQLERKKSALPESIDIKWTSSMLAGERALDTVVWQLLASVAIPGFTIHQVVALTHNLLHPHLEHLSRGELDELTMAAGALHMATNLLIAGIDKSVPTLVGLATIPFIVHPIDEGVHKLLDLTLRPAMKKIICEDMQGCEAGLDICEDVWKKNSA